MRQITKQDIINYGTSKTLLKQRSGQLCCILPDGENKLTLYSKSDIIPFSNVGEQSFNHDLTEELLSRNRTQSDFDIVAVKFFKSTIEVLSCVVRAALYDEQSEHDEQSKWDWIRVDYPTTDTQEEGDISKIIDSEQFDCEYPR